MCHNNNLFQVGKPPVYWNQVARVVWAIEKRLTRFEIKFSFIRRYPRDPYTEEIAYPRQIDIWGSTCKISPYIRPEIRGSFLEKIILI